MSTITILGEQITLVCPTSYTDRYELLGLAGDHPLRGLCAAIGWCWPVSHKGKPKASPGKRGAPNWGAYGQAVFDDLLARGVKIAEITEAGGVAVKLLNDGLPGGEAIEDVEGFTDPAGADSTG